ncbi:PREDICTED: uncharacterized protein LOC107356559 [Acropora digitifera]|uniref:uncharacterized protein LOC107356559 n=1 Tax=Acropora digitifera TaxID=70779 RepID=UPI00077AFAAE|nr:PREDICTED: uncharacterized protein LOC107356559 [Acropora digitifera]
MAEKEENSLERGRFSGSAGCRILSTQEEQPCDSLQRIKSNENISQDDTTKNHSEQSAGNFKNKDVTKQPSSTNRFATFHTQGFQNHRGNRQLRSTNRNIADQSSSHIEDSQRLATSNERHTLPVRSVSQDLPGLIPPRDIDTRPPDNEAGDKQPNRRMAVCSVTDCASFQRTKMRVYRKRF